MSTRQYVGARYVPKFASPTEWSIARSYEALTVVMYNGSSYTSKKDVPSGVNIHDENYWAHTGNYNAQVEAYRKMLEPEVDITKKKVLIIGDSYNDQRRPQYATNNVTVWGIQAMNALGIRDYKNVGVSSAGWIHIGNGNKRFIDVLRDEPDSAEYTDIIVGGGLNDVIHYSSPQNPMNDIAEFIALAKSKYPRVKVHIGVLGYTWTNYQVYEYNYVKAIRDNDLGLDFSYITNIEYAIKGKKWLLSDNLHPTQSASTRIASAVIQHMRGSVANFTDTYTYTMSQVPPIYMFYENGVTTFKTSEFPWYPEIKLNASGGYEGVLSEITNYDFTGLYNTPTNVGFRLAVGSGITLAAKTETGEKKIITGTIRLEPKVKFEPNTTTIIGTDLYITLSMVDPSTGNSASNMTIIGGQKNRFPFMSTTTNTLAF